MNAIAIDIGASYLRGAVISNKGKIVKYLKIKTPKKGKSGRVIANAVINITDSLLTGFPKRKIKGISIASIGPLNKKGEIIRSPNLKFKKVSLKKPLKKRFSLPVIIHNDCAAAVWGEKVFGNSKNYKNIVYITISSGIGGGAVIDNRLLIGRGNAAEIGHLNLDTEYNLPCSCKKGRGHWEAYCSGESLPRFLKYWLKKNKIKREVPANKTQPILDWLHKSKDKQLKAFIKEISRINGLGFSNVIAAYDPEIIILGGGMALNPKNRKMLISDTKKNTDKFLKLPKIMLSQLKDEVTLYGAAALLFYPTK